jgi:hypothetical protein
MTNYDISVWFASQSGYCFLYGPITEPSVLDTYSDTHSSIVVTCVVIGFFYCF